MWCIVNKTRKCLSKTRAPPLVPTINDFVSFFSRSHGCYCCNASRRSFFLFHTSNRWDGETEISGREYFCKLTYNGNVAFALQVTTIKFKNKKKQPRKPIYFSVACRYRGNAKSFILNDMRLAANANRDFVVKWIHNMKRYKKAGAKCNIWNKRATNFKRFSTPNGSVYWVFFMLEWNFDRFRRNFLFISLFDWNIHKKSSKKLTFPHAFDVKNRLFEIIKYKHIEKAPKVSL